MKKRVVSLLLVCLMLCAMIVPAQAATVSLSGNTTVKPGDSVVITMSVSGDIKGFQADAMRSSGMVLTNYEAAKSGWTVKSDGGVIGYSDKDEAASGNIMTFTFQVDKTATPGMELWVKMIDVVLTDGDKDTDAGTVTWTGAVAAPPSNNCDLKAIECYSGTMKPAFHKDTTYYTVTVPYEVEKLSYDYFRADTTQKVTIGGSSNLVVGENTLTFVVKAASGATKTYTLVATREQDPNYVPSDDATLKEMTVEGATLSPAFDPHITEYVAYIPFEQRELTLKGVPNDEKAVGVAEKKVELAKAENIPAFEAAVDEETGTLLPVTTYLAEDNTATLTCTAENGVTQQTYTVHIVRMPAYTGGVPQIHMTNEDDLLAAEEEPIPEEERPYEVPKTLELPLVGEVGTKTALIGGSAIVVVLMLLIGFLLGRIGRGGAAYDDDYDDDDEDGDFQRRLEQVVDQTPQPAPKPVQKPVQKPAPQPAPQPTPKPAQKPAPQPASQPVQKPAPAKRPAAPEDDLRTMSLDDLLNDIKNM